MPGDVDGRLQERHGKVILLGDLVQSFRANDGVRLHDDALVGVELARLEQDVVGQSHFPDVVQGSAALQHLDEVFINLVG